MDEIVIKKRKPADALPYLAGGAVCVLLLLIVYAVKGFFPFGAKSIAISDMCHGYIPVYYHLYDFLHGDKALFFDWYSGTGVNMVGIAAVNGLLSPLNLLFLLTPRDGIERFMNIFLLVKVFLAAVSASYFFKKRFEKLPHLYVALFSALYALSGYVLIYYMHIIWLDVLIVFPLLVYFCERMMRAKPMTPYVICVFLTLLCSFYLGVMALIGVFFIGGAYVFVVMEKQDRPRAAFRLGLGTALGAALSAFLLIPGYLQMSGSSRYSYTGSLWDIVSAKPEINTLKTVIFSFLQLAFLLVILLMLDFQKRKKASFFSVVTVLILFLPFIVEGSAMLWHFGSYKDFPFRFGFVSIFFLLALAAYVIGERGDEMRLKLLKPVQIAVSAALVAALAYLNYRYYRAGIDGTDGSTLSGADALKISALLFAVGLFAYFMLLTLKNAKIRRIAVCAVSLLQILPVALFSFGTDTNIRFERREHDTDYIAPTQAVAALSGLDNTRLERMHDPDMCLNINYGFVAGFGAQSNWTHQIPAGLQDSRRALGYSTTYTLLLDGGGTLFSDALLNMKETVSRRELDENLYSLKGAADGYRLYENAVTLPNALFANSTDMDFSVYIYDQCSRIFENQNRMYTAMGGEGLLIRTTENSPEIVASHSEARDSRTWTIAAGEREALYFTAPNTAQAWVGMQITVNGKIIPIPSYQREKNTYYTSEYNNNCLFLGFFDGENVSVRIDYFTDKAKNCDYAIGLLSVPKLESLSELQKGYGAELTAGKKSVDVSITNAPSSGYLILPVAYDEGWSAEVNGEAASVEQAAGYLCAVRVGKGASEVKMRFSPKGTKYGVLASVAGLAALAALAFVEIRKIELRRVRFLEFFAMFVLFVGWIGALLLVYAAPLVCSVIGVFKHS
ncbi:MAG: YfhO family protein [Clostridia bacterium]|nr:YfhO family protein [Clostridia bacterium]